MCVWTSDEAVSVARATASVTRARRPHATLMRYGELRSSSLCPERGVGGADGAASDDEALGRVCRLAVSAAGLAPSFDWALPIFSAGGAAFGGTGRPLRAG